MVLEAIMSRFVGKYRRTVASILCRRSVILSIAEPMISFSFDDAPKSAFRQGGDVLSSYNAKATYYVSLGLLGANSTGGVIASHDELSRALADGHELGCHTFEHQDAWHTPVEKFEQSIYENRRALAEHFPTAAFLTHAYPINMPRPITKYRVGKLFNCCRGGGQTYNIGKIDLNLVKAYFLDSRIKKNIDDAKKMIDQSVACRGWLIFATHDIDNEPSPYGCTKKYLEEVVSYCARSGASIRTVNEACKVLQQSLENQEPAKRYAA